MWFLGGEDRGSFKEGMSSWGNFEIGKIGKIYMMCWLMWVIVFDFWSLYSNLLFIHSEKSALRLEMVWFALSQPCLFFFHSPSFVCLSWKPIRSHDFKSPWKNQTAIWEKVLFTKIPTTKQANLRLPIRRASARLMEMDHPFVRSLNRSGEGGRVFLGRWR